MSIKKHAVDIRQRNESFTQRIQSTITQEHPSPDNPFLVQTQRIHGYNLIDLMEQRSALDVFFLLFNGELPTSAQRTLFNALAISIMDPGPRSPAARAAINAAVGKTANEHLVPLACMAASGDYQGATEVAQAMRFLHQHQQQAANDCAVTCAASTPDTTGDWCPAPGFGTDMGGQSPLVLNIKEALLALAPATGYFHWANQFASALQEQRANAGWRLPGVIAAGLLDLGFTSAAGAGLYQVLIAPGALAQGLAFVGKPLTAAPFLDDAHYDIDYNA